MSENLSRVGSRGAGWTLKAASMVRKALGTVAALLFIATSHIPVAIHANYRHDDGLFVSLGESLAAGNWMGSYDELTLIKGPGYPLFLAVNSWLGLPIVLAHALFHCVAVAFFFWAFARVTRLNNLAVVGFVFTLWAPIDYFDRITRDAIYPGQMLLVFGAVCYAFLGGLPPRKRVAWASLAGVATGWFVLTREEGIWIVPGISIVIFYAAWASWRQRAFGGIALYPVIAMALALLSTQVAFSAGNWAEYGTWTGVETTSAPFTSAMQALQSVEVGRRTPYVPVSRQARQAIYEVSPSFRSLRDYFDPPGGATPWQFGCEFYPQTCGDIAGGWFLWAFRDAVAERGLYSSPAVAAGFYRKLAAEIQGACRDGRIHCSTTFPSSLPHISYPQWQNLPASLTSGILQATYAQLPDITPEPSSGNPAEIASQLAFLGRPLTTEVPTDATTAAETYRVSGWYRSPTNGWVSAQLEESDGRAVAISVPRMKSPDLVMGFKDPIATDQRFDFQVACASSCTVRFIGENHASTSLSLKDLVGQRPQYPLGPATLNIDSVSGSASASAEADDRVHAATSMRRMALRLYGALMPWLAAAALAAMLISLIRAFFKRRLSIPTIVAAAAWALLASRLLLLGIVDISSFPGMITQYLATANIAMCLCVILSFGSLFSSVGLGQSAGGAPQPDEAF